MTSRIVVVGASIGGLTTAETLRQEGFEPFMVCQTRVRHEGRRDFTKHMLRLRHASQINGREANEIILLNSHDGTSSYQMLAGMFRFVCSNGLVCGDTVVWKPSELTPLTALACQALIERAAADVGAPAGLAGLVGLVRVSRRAGSSTRSPFEARIRSCSG